MSDRLPPQNLEAEDHVLGSMLMSPTAVDISTELLHPADFYRGSNAAVFSVVSELHLDGVAVDAITVIDRLEEKKADGKSILEQIGGRTRIHELANIVPATANVRHYANIVKEAAVLRRMLNAGQTIASNAYERPGDTDELVEQAEALVYALRNESDRSSFVVAGDALAEAMERLRELHERGSTVIGVPSGYRALDGYTAGFQPGELTVLAARPSMGKTGLALGVCAHVAIHQALPVGLFTLEMGQQQIIQRLLAIEASVDVHHLRIGKLDGQGWDRVYNASGKIKNAPLFIDDSGTVSILELRSKARRLKARNPKLALLVIDYLQLMGGSGSEENRVQEVSRISRSLKQLARELEVPILALSQLSRAVETRHDKRPLLSDLRESGAIEQDADIVMFLYRDEYYSPEDEENAGIAELNLAKHRNGPTGTVKLSFVKRYARFTDLVLPGDLSSQPSNVR